VRAFGTPQKHLWMAEVFQTLPLFVVVSLQIQVFTRALISLIDCIASVGLNPVRQLNLIAAVMSADSTL